MRWNASTKRGNVILTPRHVANFIKILWLFLRECEKKKRKEKKHVEGFKSGS